MANGNGNGENKSNDYLGWRILTGGLVVTFSLLAVVVSLLLLLDNYDVSGIAPAGGDTAAASDNASVSASSVVAVLTPVIAGIVGIAGLFFGISATGSPRGRQAESQQKVAESNAEATKEAALALQAAAEKT